MSVSILCPTRGRPALLEASIRSLFALSDRKVPDIQVLLAVDQDDVDTHPVADRLGDVVRMHWPRKGYLRLHEYVNDLVPHAEGDWLFLWNDDARMESFGWDRIVSRQAPYGVLDPRTNHPPQHDGLMTFPIVHRTLVDTLGWFSRSPHCDTYIQYVADGVGVRRPVPIRVFHDRPDITGRAADATHDERELGITTPAFYEPAMQAMIAADIAKLREAGYGS